MNGLVIISVTHTFPTRPA